MSQWLGARGFEFCHGSSRNERKAREAAPTFGAKSGYASDVGFIQDPQ